MKFTVLPACSFILALTCWETRAERFQFKEHPAEVTLVAEQPTLMLGEPASVSFVVTNLSEQPLWVPDGAFFGSSPARPAAFTVKAVGADGTAAPHPEAGPNFGGIGGLHEIVAHGSYPYRLFLPEWIRFEQPGIYRLTVRRTLPIRDSVEGWDWRVHPADPTVTAITTIEVAPFNPEKMGRMISKLGDTTLQGNQSEAESAARTLASIHDARVIPLFVKAVEKKDYALKFTALGALDPYNDEEAFRGLQRGLAVQARDFEDGANPKVLESLANNIQYADSIALRKSPYPRAIPYLLSQRHQVDESSRHTALLAATELPLEQAVPIVQEMTHDESDAVSQEAKRNLILLAGKLKPGDAIPILEKLTHDKAKVVADEATEKFNPMTGTSITITP